MASLWASFLLAFFPPAPLAEWTALNANYSDYQADANLVQFGGLAFLIDVGTVESNALKYLEWRGVRKIEAIFISHPHRDHYGGLWDLAASRIQIGEVLWNMPDKKQCDHEIPWGCDYGHVLQTRKMLSEKGIPVRDVAAGKTFAVAGVELKVLYSYDGVHTPIGRVSINDLSLIMKLTAGPTTVLFTGDLDTPLGTYLGEKGENLESTILKIPHHGMASHAPNSFFDRVNPKAAVVPCPFSMWITERASQARDYVRAKHIRTWVTGYHGHTRFLFRPGGFEPFRSWRFPRRVDDRGINPWYRWGLYVRHHWIHRF